MGLICNQTEYMYAGILRYEKKYVSKNPKKLQEIKRFIEGLAAHNKFSVHMLAYYKAFYEPDWNWSQFGLYQDGVNYAKELRDKADEIIRKKVKIDGFDTTKMPQVLHKDGYRLVNGFANIYFKCQKIISNMEEDEREYFEGAVISPLLRAYSMAERIEEKIKEYEKRPDSPQAVKKITNQKGKFDYEPEKMACEYREEMLSKHS